MQSITVKRKMSFLHRIENIEASVKRFATGQAYIEPECLTQLSNIESVCRHGTSKFAIGAWSVHSMVRTGYIATVRNIVLNTPVRRATA